MKRWIAYGWIITAAFTGSAYIVIRLEPQNAVLPLTLDTVTVATAWACLWLLRDHI